MGCCAGCGTSLVAADVINGFKLPWISRASVDLCSSWFNASVSIIGVGFNVHLRNDGGVAPDLGC